MQMCNSLRHSFAPNTVTRVVASNQEIGSNGYEVYGDTLNMTVVRGTHLDGKAKLADNESPFFGTTVGSTMLYGEHCSEHRHHHHRHH